MELYGAFRRYEDQRKGDMSARLVKGLDKYDMILQAWEYFSEA
jgi:5'-deoxynucleotidase YfbR-like HD superfamily hydrolase